MSAPLVFITGASSGIGQALAARYARAGWRLALVARRTEVLEAWVRAQGLASEVLHQPGQVLAPLPERRQRDVEDVEAIV